MQDLYGREIKYMRISITDRCNLRCRYCMPEGISLLPSKDIMSYEEILMVCQEAVALGIDRFKITGGEPLVRKGCAELIRQLRKISGVRQVTLTTNGVLLKKELPTLMDAGLDAVNISLDTLKKERFREITGFDALDEVKAAIESAIASGIAVKTNTVLQEEINADEWLDILKLAKEQKLDVRFIELMPVGYGGQAKGVSNQMLLKWLRREFPDMIQDEKVHGNGPAVYYKIPGFIGNIGLISAIHGRFCDGCNRIRLTSTGIIKPCLCYQEGVSVRDAARNREGNAVGELLKKAVLMKPEKHCFEDIREMTEKKAMVEIGG